MQSAIYSGTVAHKRLKPRTHAFRYRAYWLLLDLDELPALDGSLRCFSYNRWNLLSFKDCDHGDGSSTPLRMQIARHLAAGGIDIEGGAIRILCMPRIVGFVFNPLSVYFCYGASGTLKAILYEVHNTFRQRHSYLIAQSRAPSDRSIEQNCSKRFYVSPFMPMDMSYRFRVLQPAQHVNVTVYGDDPGGPLIVAALTGRRIELTDRALLRQFFVLPLMTVKVVAAIHWQAIRLWLKGIRLYPRPEPPPNAVTTTGRLDRVAAE